MLKFVSAACVVLCFALPAVGEENQTTRLFHIGEENFVAELHENDEFILVMRIEEQADSGAIDEALAVDIGRAFLRHNRMRRCAIAFTEAVDEGTFQRVYYHCPLSHS
ncbi:hypothetical protein [Cochlodiniinecator piscidefendens]|uniref:hypothetical protein n=1 Tax=Cochlodiniinecator piscidefendens TaxID=2715756 RepID=UPI00140C682C|nr:hypothetical protein [Cochlodiniinecator piscidefendens]